jgi:diacylglycerol kinase family enzyme
MHALVDGEPVRARAILVANNRYALDLFTLGARERLDAGELQLRSADGVLPTSWDERVSERFRIEVPGGRVHAAIDGEPVPLDSPLNLEAMPLALRVLVPSR